MLFKFIVEFNGNNIFTEPFTASGGTEITDGDNKYHVFTSPGNFVVNTGEKSKFDVLVIGGGGGGGENNSGGGGAGGLVIYSTTCIFPWNRRTGPSCCRWWW